MKNLTSIDHASLVTVTGGTTKATTDTALTQQLQTVTSALDDLKRGSQNQSGMAQYLPMIIAAKFMRQ